MELENPTIQQPATKLAGSSAGVRRLSAAAGGDLAVFGACGTDGDKPRRWAAVIGSGPFELSNPLNAVKRRTISRVCCLSLLTNWPALAGLALWTSMACRVQSATFTNSTFISIPVGAMVTPYPSSITVSAEVGDVVSVSATLMGVRHVYSGDLDVLLVGPGGQRVILMSDVGGSEPLGDVDLKFVNSGGATLPDLGPIFTGSYAPTDYEPGDVLPSPAPDGPFGTDLTVFDGTDPNGTWQMYVYDDSAANGGGSISRGWALNLELASPPEIVTQPQDQTLTPGGTAVFEVKVIGTPPFSYQWLRNGQVLVPFESGADTLTITNVQATNAGIYTVVVTNSANPAGVLSSNAMLNVLGPLTVVESPQSQEAKPGDAVQFRVTAAGDPPLHYQWQKNGALLTGQTNSTLSFDNAQAVSGGAFNVTVLNQNEAVTTAAALLVVNAATEPHPTDDFVMRPRLQGMQGVMQGDSARATSARDEPVFPGGGKTVWCEWLAPADGIVAFTTQGSAFDSLLSVFTGTTVSNLALVTADDDLGGYYTSTVQFNAQQGTSYQIMLDGYDYEGIGGKFTLSWLLQPTKKLLPVITSPPVSQAVLSGSNATFQVTAEPPGLSYQWYFGEKPIRDATGSVYTVTQVSSNDVGFYSARMISGSGLALQSPQVELQLGTTPDALMHFKYQSVSQPSANGNRPGAGFISIGIGGTDYLQAPATNAGALNLTPCNNPFSTKYRYRGLEATNNGVIHVSTAGSQILTRLAVYLDPMSLNPIPLDCDTTSAPAVQPGTLLFDATNGSRYMIVVEAYQADGDVDLTSAMGVAPPIPEAPDYCMIPPGGSILLSMPATNWVPVPDCQWRHKGVDILDATNTTLLVTNFSLVQTGAYSVVMSNFVRATTNTVAVLDLGGPLTLEPTLATNSGSVDLVITASNATPFLLLTKTNLDSNLPWLPLTTNLESCQTFLFTNTNILADPYRFFRVIPWPPSGP